MPELRLDLIYQEQNAQAITRAIAQIRALSAAADENVRRMGPYAGGVFNVRAMAEAEAGLGRAVGAYQRLGSEIERTAAVGRLVPQSFRAAADAALGFEGALTRTAQTYRGLLDQFGRKITVGTAADVGGMAPGFAERVATGAAVSRAENIAQERAYRAEITNTTAALAAYGREEDRIAKLGASMAPRESIATHRREQLQAAIKDLRDYQAAQAAADRFSIGAAPRSSVVAHAREQASATTVIQRRDVERDAEQAAARAAIQQREIQRDVEHAVIRTATQRRDVERDAEQARARAATQVAAQHREMEQFNAQIQTMGGRTFTPIRFERSMLGDIRAVRAEVEATGHGASQLGYFFNRAAVEMGEMARHARGQQISSLFATMRRVGAVGSIPLIGGIGAVMGAAELIHVATAMGKLAQETQNAAAATGMSVGQFSLLQRQMQLMGGNAESAVRLFGFLGTAVDQALVDPMSKARGAFVELGVSMDQLRDATQNPMNLLDVLRQKFQSMDEAQRKLVFGRNFEALIPYLRMTQAEFERTKQTALESGAVMGDDTVTQLAKTREATAHLSESFAGLGIAITKATTGSGLIDWLASAVEGATKLVDKWGQLPPNPYLAPSGMQGDSLHQRLFPQDSPRAVVAVPETTGADAVTKTLALVKTLEGSAAGAVSKAGAVGTYQIKPETAKGAGFTDATTEKLKDATYNQTVATKLVSQYLEKFNGSVQDVLIAYNAGPGAVAKFHATGQLPNETQRYLAHAGMPAGGMPPATTGKPPAGMIFAALNDPQLDPGKLASELDKNIKVIAEETQLRQAQTKQKIADANKDQNLINTINQEDEKYAVVQAKRVDALRQQYAGRAAQFSARAGEEADPEIQTRLLGGKSSQIGVIEAQTKERLTQNAIDRQQLEAKKELLEGDLALAKTPEKRLEINNQIAQVDSQLSTSIQAQAVLQQKLSQAAKEYTKEIERQATKQREAADIVGQRQAKEQIQQVKARKDVDISFTPQAAIQAEAAITQRFLAEQEKRWQGAKSAATENSDAWVEAGNKVAETQAQAAEKQAEYFRQLADLAKKAAKEYEHAFTQAFDTVSGEIKSIVNTDIKDLITGWPQATQQVEYFQTKAASGLPIVGERVRQISPAMTQLINLETKAAQAAVDLALKLGEMAAAKGLGALLGVATGPGTEAGTSIGGVLGAKAVSLIPGLGGAATNAAITDAPIITTITAQTPLLISGITGPIVSAISSSGAASAAATLGAKGLGMVAGIGGHALSSVLFPELEAPAFIARLLAAESGGIVPSAAGGWIVPGTRGGQLAMVHANEMVLPANISQGLQTMLGGGESGRADVNDPYGGGDSGDTHFHIHAHDTQTGAAFLMRHAGTIARAARTGASRNAVTMRGFAG